MNKTERIAFIILTFLVWVYLGLRSYNIPLIHDETVTYYLYIQDGNFIPPWAYWDANNHLLNSAFGALFKVIFGHSPFLARLGSWLSFIPFVIFLYGLSNYIKGKVFKWAFIIPLISTPFFIEFFSLTRGYGMAMSWFLGTLLFAMKYAETRSNKYFIGLGITGLLTSLSSLSVIVAVFIVYGWVLLEWYFTNKEKTVRFGLKWFGWLMLPQLPLVYYVFQLKDKGLLYYGGDEVVKYSLEPFARYFFNNRELWWVAAIAISFLFGFYLITFMYQQFKPVFKVENLPAFVLILSLISVFAQHFIIGVNYPEDRASLYFFPLIVFSIANIPVAKWVKFAVIIPLLWFPIDLVLSANIQYSKLWPNEHVPTRFWDKVTDLKTEYPASFSAYFLRNGVWNYHSLDKEFSSSPNSADYPSKWADVLLVDSVRIKKVDLSLYKQIDYDLVSGQTLLIRQPGLEEKVERDTSFTNLPIVNLYTNLFEFDGATWEQNAMALYYDFDLKATSNIVHLNIITTLFDTTGTEIFSAKYDLGLVSEHWKERGKWRVKQFLPPFPANAGRFVSYIYNPKGEQHSFEIISTKLAVVSEPEKK